VYSEFTIVFLIFYKNIDSKQVKNSITNSLKDLKVPDLKEFSYSLPQERIAMYPLPERDMSKLLIYNNGIILENIFRNIFEYLPENGCFVFNNSKVIKARFFFEKESGGKIEILCLEPLTPVGLYESLMSKKTVEWKCIIGHLKKWKDGIVRRSFIAHNKTYNLYAERVGKENGDSWRIRFSWEPDDLTFAHVIELAGHVPLPPYIKRDDEPEDCLRYQTVYSKIEGSVAAPTAGLHFTPELLEKARKKSIEHIEITLHVSAGTFLPVKGKNIIEHEMHREFFSVDASSIERLLRTIGKHSPIISVGTTSMRALESIYWAGVKLSRNYNESVNDNCNNINIYVDQWEPYITDSPLKVSESLEVLLNWMTKKGISTLRASTRLIIVPGYRFMIPDVLITNFHMPESTLLLLIAAWIGPDWKKVYNYAISKNFRFLSYGDSSLLFRNKSDITRNYITNF